MDGMDGWTDGMRWFKVVDSSMASPVQARSLLQQGPRADCASESPPGAYGTCHTIISILF